MEIEYIKEFLILAKRCNYGQAAEELYISKSTLFNHIKALEAEAGVPFFNKIGKKTVLNEYGRIFVPCARQIVNIREGFSRDVEIKREEKSRTIRIDTQYRITDLISSFQEKHPDIIVQFNDSHGDFQKGLQSGKYDVAVAQSLTEVPKQLGSQFYRIDMAAVLMSSGHPLAERESVDISELEREKFVMISPINGKECLGARYCRDVGFAPRISAYVESGYHAVNAVREGIGISILSRHLITEQNCPGIYVAGLTPTKKFPISFYWLRDAEESGCLREFLEYAAKFTRDNGWNSSN